MKGVGWVHGPPWVLPSPKDAELVFGLLDGNSASRELLISERLREIGVHATNACHAVPLNEELLRLIGITPDIAFLNGRAVNPVALVVESLSPYRVSDIGPRQIRNWRTEFAKWFCVGESSITENAKLKSIGAFATLLAASIQKIHDAGGVNDTLSADNVTIAGEITDFEWLYVPPIALPDGSTDEMLGARQRKEAIYFVDVLLVLAEGLECDLTISQAAQMGLDGVRGRIKSCAFRDELAKIAMVS
jgi:hypothetical protein